jgi:transposase InsO family protein
MRKQYPVSIAGEVLQVSTSGYFTWARQHKARRTGPPGRFSDEALLTHMLAIHADVKQEYGWPRMHKKLLARGIRVGKERVRRLMKQHGIRAKIKRKFVVTTDSKHNVPMAPDLVQRKFNPEAPSQLWSGDITYIAADEGVCTWRLSLTCSVGRGFWEINNESDEKKVRKLISTR